MTSTHQLTFTSPYPDPLPHFPGIPPHLQAFRRECIQGLELCYYGQSTNSPLSTLSVPHSRFIRPPTPDIQTHSISTTLSADVCYQHLLCCGSSTHRFRLPSEMRSVCVAPQLSPFTKPSTSIPFHFFGIQTHDLKRCLARTDSNPIIGMIPNSMSIALLYLRSPHAR